MGYSVFLCLETIFNPTIIEKVYMFKICTSETLEVLYNKSMTVSAQVVIIIKLQYNSSFLDVQRFKMNNIHTMIKRHSITGYKMAKTSNTSIGGL